MAMIIVPLCSFIKMSKLLYVIMAEIQSIKFGFILLKMRSVLSYQIFSNNKQVYDIITGIDPV